MYNLQQTNISGLFVITPEVHEDKRGFFMETYNQQDFEELGLNYNFVQDNHSRSAAGVLRGLHFQKKHPQAKLVRVLNGSVYDVAVDLRPYSQTYGQYYGTILSGENKRMLMIPTGFAHGFLVLSETADFAYKCDDFYYPDDQDGIIWNDTSVNIHWPIGLIAGGRELILSEKDKNWKGLTEWTKDQF